MVSASASSRRLTAATCTTKVVVGTAAGLVLGGVVFPVVGWAPSEAELGCVTCAVEVAAPVEAVVAGASTPSGGTLEGVVVSVAAESLQIWPAGQGTELRAWAGEGLLSPPLVVEVGAAEATLGSGCGAEARPKLNPKPKNSAQTTANAKNIPSNLPVPRVISVSAISPVSSIPNLVPTDITHSWIAELTRLCLPPCRPRSAARCFPCQIIFASRSRYRLEAERRWSCFSRRRFPSGFADSEAQCWLAALPAE